MRNLLISIFTLVPLLAQTYSYDQAGRLLRVAYPNGGGLEYTYDASDNLTSVRSLNISPAPSGLQLTSDTSGVRLIWQAVSGAQAYLVYRTVGDSGDWQEIGRVNALSFIDPSATPGVAYSYRIAAQTPSGLTAYSEPVTLSTSAPTDPRSTRELSLGSGAAASIRTTGTSQETRAGYATVSLESGEAPYGLAVFQLIQNGVVVGETGVPASPPSRGNRIFVENRDALTSPGGQFTGTLNINTGIAFVNPNTETANYRITLRDRNGNSVASGQASLPAGHHTTRLLTDLQQIVPDFAYPSDFATTSQFGTLDITSDRPLSAMALRLTINQRGELLFSTTAVVDTQLAVPTTPMLFAHLPEGGGFNSKIALINTTPSEQTGQLRIFDDFGAAFLVRTMEGETASVFSYRIPAGGAWAIETDGSSANVRAGWVEVNPDPGQTTPSGSGTFRYAQNGIITTESGIPAALTTTSARVFVDLSTGYGTGIAIANPGSPGTITFRAFALDGVSPAGSPGAPVSLPANGHTAAEANALVTGLPAGFVGTIEMDSATPFVALTVRSLFNARGELLFTTFPVADQTRPAPSPVIFPHLADGGGFRTELILLSPRNSSQSTVRLFDSAGSPLLTISQ